ncbi:hypothetical protein H0H92_005583, partial [Tricholoma furcatifolium]
GRCVGQDLVGNRFYEFPNSNDPRRTRRTVEYQNPDDVWQYIGGGKRLATFILIRGTAVQWSAWLSHTRQYPPTLEELQLDAAKQQRVQLNVALIEAREREEKAEMLRIQQQHDQQMLKASIEPQKEVTQQPQDAPAETKSSLPKMGTGADSYEPEAWSPRIRTRGG